MRFQLITQRFPLARVAFTALISSLLLFSSCKSDQVTPAVVSPNETKFDLTQIAPQLRGNAQVYVFQGAAGPSKGYFDHRVMNINRINDKMSMSIPVGMWDIALISAPAGTDMGQIIQPTSGDPMASTKMWENQPFGGNLPSAPEFFTSYIQQQPILVDQTQDATTSLVRNVSMIKIVVKDARGFKTGTPVHKVSLTNVPSALTWAGGLFPNKTTPLCSPIPMNSTITMSGTENQVSDTAIFIVPAHRGSDFLAQDPADTTTHKMGLSVSFVSDDGSLYTRDNIEIPLVAKANKIIVVNLILKATVEFETQTHDWTTHDIDADLSNASINVTKTVVNLSSTDTIYVKTNHNFHIESVASFLTVTKLGSDRVVIAADPSSYDAPRSTYFDIVVNKSPSGSARKRIIVRQRPEEGLGFLSVTPFSIWLSPSSGNKSKIVNVLSEEAGWRVVGNPKTAALNVISAPAGLSNVTLTRNAPAFDNGNYTMYGTEKIKFRHDGTLEEVELTVDNLYMRADDIYIRNPVNPDTTVISNTIEIWGLSKSCVVTSAPEWVTSATYIPNQGLQLTVEHDQLDEGREGQITIAHADDPNYTITFNVIQSINVVIPEFAFFVVKLTWENNDIDIGVRFMDNNAPFDRRIVGFGMTTSGSIQYERGSYVPHNGKMLLQWGGDATGGQGETAFFNTTVIDNDNTLPRKIKLEVWATWWTTARRGSPVTVTYTPYMGGYMHWGVHPNIPGSSASNFYNIGGTQVQDENGIPIQAQKKLYLNSSNRQTSSGLTDPTGGAVKPDGTTESFAKLVEFTYDRVKHTAVVKWIAPECFTRSAPVAAPVPSEAENAAAAAQKEIEAATFR